MNGRFEGPTAQQCIQGDAKRQSRGGKEEEGRKLGSGKEAAAGI